MTEIRYSHAHDCLIVEREDRLYYFSFSEKEIARFRRLMIYLAQVDASARVREEAIDPAKLEQAKARWLAEGNEPKKAGKKKTLDLDNLEIEL